MWRACYPFADDRPGGSKPQAHRYCLTTLFVIWITCDEQLPKLSLDRILGVLTMKAAETSSRPENSDMVNGGAPEQQVLFFSYPMPNNT